MKTLRFLSFILLLFTLALPLYSQESAVVPQRTPEQEAARQTEKLQKELNLTSEQTKRVYEINLRYARERQISNTRNEAIERMKNKNADIQRVLNYQQNERLQSKWIERTSISPSSVNRTQSNVPATFRSSTEYRSNVGSRVASPDVNRQMTVRRSQGFTEQGGAQSPQTVRRGSSQIITRPSVSVPSVRSEQSQQTAPANRTSSYSGSSSTRSESTSGSRR